MKTSRCAWRITDADFPAEGSEAEKLRYLVDYAVLAPSKYNSQPWLFELHDNTLDLICDRSWAFRVTDPESRELILSCGAALLNLRLAAQHFGHPAMIETFPCPGDRYLLARIKLGVAPRNEEPGPLPTPRAGQTCRHRTSERPLAFQQSDEGLFRAMRKRRTHRGYFYGTPPEELLARCCNIAAKNGAWLHIIQDTQTRRALGDLVAWGDREQMANRAFRRELARWIHPVRGKSKDGLSASVFGLRRPLDLLSPGLSLLLWTINWGRLIAAHDRKLLESSPVLAVLSTTHDTPQAWLAAGQALEAVLLHATVAGLGASFLNQPIEVEHLRKELPSVLGRRGFPQILLRLGYGGRARHTPRRPANEVLI
jgi:nitroreductase